MKINRYMHDHGISAGTLAKVAAKNYRNGSLNPNAFRRKPLSEEEILGLADAQLPADPVHVLRPDEGAAAVVLCRADIAHRYTERRSTSGPARSGPGGIGAYEVNASLAPVEEDVSPDGVRVAEPPSRRPGSARRTSTSIQLQDTDAGAEVIHMAENGLCADGEQEKLVADGATEIGGPMPINTDGGLIANGEPIGASGLRQVHELVLQLRGKAGDRQVPGTPRVGYAQVYGAPGTAAATILSL